MESNNFKPQPIGKPVEHDRMLWQAKFSPDGQWLIGVGQDATIQRWKVVEASGDNPGLEKKEAFTGHNGWVQCLAFHPTNGRVFTADSWGKIAAWKFDAEGASEPLWKNETAHDGWIRALAISPDDGSLLATAGNDQTVRLWSTESGEKVREWPHGSRVMSLAFTTNGESLVSGDLPGVIREWKAASGEKVREVSAAQLYAHHNIQDCGGVRKLVFNAAGDRLAAVGQKAPQGGFATGVPCVLVYDWQAGTIVREMPVGDKDDGFAYDALFHPAGFVMAVASAFPNKGPLWFWRPEEEAAFLIEKQRSNGLSLSLHPDGKRVAMLVCHSPNGNGRPKGEYPGGSSRIVMLSLEG